MIQHNLPKMLTNITASQCSVASLLLIRLQKLCSVAVIAPLAVQQFVHVSYLTKCRRRYTVVCFVQQGTHLTPHVLHKLHMCLCSLLMI